MNDDGYFFSLKNSHKKYGISHSVIVYKLNIPVWAIALSKSHGPSLSLSHWHCANCHRNSTNKPLRNLHLHFLFIVIMIFTLRRPFWIWLKINSMCTGNPLSKGIVPIFIEFCWMVPEKLLCTSCALNLW